MAGFYGSICLTDIPRELISTGKNGKKYLYIEIGERRQPSQFGATHYVKASVKQEQKRDGVNYYIGDLKPSRFDNGGQPTQQTVTAAPAGQAQAFNTPDENGDLPF